MSLSPQALELRRSLLDLHRAVIAFEREVYERRSGRINAAAFLRVLIDDTAYGWLRPLSALIVKMDDDAEEQAQQAEAALFAEARALVRPDFIGAPFQQRYAWLVEQSPDVTYAHGAVQRALKKAAPASKPEAATLH